MSKRARYNPAQHSPACIKVIDARAPSAICSLYLLPLSLTHPLFSLVCHPRLISLSLSSSFPFLAVSLSSLFNRKFLEPNAPVHLLWQMRLVPLTFRQISIRSGPYQCYLVWDSFDTMTDRGALPVRI